MEDDSEGVLAALGVLGSIILGSLRLLPKTPPGQDPGKEPPPGQDPNKPPPPGQDPNQPPPGQDKPKKPPKKEPPGQKKKIGNLEF